MAQIVSSVGVDCGKSSLDAAIYPGADRIQVENTPAGRRALAVWVKERMIGVAGMEASGGYERDIRDELTAAGLSVRVFDPARVRHYAKAKGRRAKNDAIDAAVIAEFTALQVDTSALPADPAREALAGLIRTRRLLVDKRADLRRATAGAPAAAKAALESATKALADAIATLDAEIGAQVAAKPALAAKVAALQTAPGVGPVVARTLAVLAPELGGISGRQASALIGIAPYDHDSGRLRGQRHIAGGRADARNALYMAAVVAAMRTKGVLADFYAELRKRGKPAKVALVACMRKLVVRLNAMLAKGKTWEATPA